MTQSAAGPSMKNKVVCWYELYYIILFYITECHAVLQCNPHRRIIIIIIIVIINIIIIILILIIIILLIIATVI